MLVEVGTCINESKPHIKCDAASWRFVFTLSFSDKEPLPAPATEHAATTEADKWIETWDESNDPDVIQLCRISYTAGSVELKKRMAEMIRALKQIQELAGSPTFQAEQVTVLREIAVLAATALGHK